MFEMDQEAFRYGITPVENTFLTDYLPAAKGDFVKVYLWALMQAQKGLETSLEETAQSLFLSVSQVEAALRYWERRALIVKLSDNPPRYRFYSALQQAMRQGTPLETDGSFVAFSENVYALFEDRRKITPSEISLAWEWVEDLGLTQEVVLMLLSHCINQRGVQFSLKKAEPLAVRMKEENVLSPDDADLFLRHEQAVHDGARKVLARMGKRRLASEDELALYHKWVKEWGFDQMGILDACAETTKGDPSFKYLDSILNGIRSRSSARTGEQVKQQLEKETTLKEQYMQVFENFRFKTAPAVARRLYGQWLQLLPHETMVLAAHLFSRSGGTLEDFEALLEDWKKKGLTAESDARTYLFKMREENTLLREIFTACGYQGRPTEKDRLLLQKWRTMGMNDDLLLQAASQAKMAEGSKLAYLDKVLAAWHEAGITDVSQARPASAAKRAPARQKQVSAQGYAQREYTEEQLALVSEDLIEEVRRNRG